MAAAIAEPPHLAEDLKTLHLSTVASQWRPLAEQAARGRQAPADYLAELVMNAAEAGHTRVVQALIAAGADSNATDSGGWTALMQAATAVRAM